ncbi:hypothetical protein ASG29_00090 [Sphingomonas sp. Leaf412]|nr:FxDxF family PEP-CTERM protein [Sphingomonas sp. Leaf412]KQT34617.1 hypothetical protein ASG29_00090 [Sphingomonas sp. Leaf412]
MRFIKGIAAAALIAAIVPNSASAATYFDYTTNVGGDFGNPDPTTKSSPFTDTYDFVTSFARSATVEILSNMSTPTAFKENVNFIFNGVKLDATVIPATETGQFERRYLANFRLPAGAHQILVRGSAGVDGQYTGTLSLAGVPEPTTWALMILGMGAIGGAMRRRAAKTTVAFA